MDAIIVKYDQGQASFIRYTILVTHGDQSWSILRRFNDFSHLHEALCRSFPHFPGRLPPKKWFGRFNPEFLQERKVELQQYLDSVTSLPGFPERSQEGCVFFEVDRHLAGQDAEDKVHQDASALGSPAQVEEARISSILWEASHAFINTSSPLHQVSIEQMDPEELAQQRSKLLQRTSGLRVLTATVPRLISATHLQQAHRQGQPQPGHDVVGRGKSAGLRTGGRGVHGSDGKECSRGSIEEGGVGVIDVLSAPSRMTLGAQADLLEKQGLSVADKLREARLIRTTDDKDLIYRVGEERA